MSQDDEKKGKPPIHWEVVCGRHEPDGPTAMMMTIGPLPNDEELLRAFAERLRDVGIAFLTERGICEGKIVDLSPAGPSDRVQ